MRDPTYPGLRVFFRLALSVALILAFIALAGCASFTAPTNEVRVTEYGASSGVLTGGAIIGGCRVVQYRTCSSSSRVTHSSHPSGSR